MIKALISFVTQDGKPVARWTPLVALPSIGMDIVIPMDGGFQGLGQIRHVVVSPYYAVIYMRDVVEEETVVRLGLKPLDEMARAVPEDIFEMFW